LGTIRRGWIVRPRALRILCLAVAAALALTVSSARVASASAPAPARAWVLVGHSSLQVGCGTAGTTLAADWYFPDGGVTRPTGIVWLQHAFFQTKDNLVALAQSIAANTGAIVVAPTITSNPFAAGGCWINGAPMASAVANLFVGERSALQSSADAARGGHVWLPRRFVLSGNSAGGNLATGAAGDTALAGGDIADLRGVVLFDAVDYGTSMQDALARLTGGDDRPVLQIASPPNPCNAFGSGTAALLSARPDRFVGVELVNGTHLDAEGPNIGLLAEAVCGRPETVNVDAVRELAADWITNAFTGSSLGIVGGSPGQAIPVGGATAIVLPTGAPA
jgi:hypothetical protein